MSRLAATFARTAAAGRAALVAFVTAGDPTTEATGPILDALVAGGLGGVGHSRRVGETSDKVRSRGKLRPNRDATKRRESGVCAQSGRAVSTIGSPSVMAIVCSECAPREPSVLRRVHPSGSV